MNKKTKIYQAKTIITMNSYLPKATHVAVRDGRILGAGTLEELERWGAYTLDETFADKVTPLQYETLVGDFEAQLRYVLARCGLSWSRRCLEYYNVERAVMTFSATQVRKPPSADHLDSTSPYAGWLTPFDAALAAHPVDPATGAWLGEGGEPETDPADRPPELMRGSQATRMRRARRLRAKHELAGKAGKRVFYRHALKT